MGGGYVLSADVVHTLLHVNQTMKLKFTPIEDATVGFWLMSMDLRFIHHPKILGYAAPCCFKLPVRREGQRIVTRWGSPVVVPSASASSLSLLLLQIACRPRGVNMLYQAGEAGWLVQKPTEVHDPSRGAVSRGRLVWEGQ